MTTSQRGAQHFRVMKEKEEEKKLMECLGDCGKKFMTTPSKRLCPSCTIRVASANQGDFSPVHSVIW